MVQPLTLKTQRDTGVEIVLGRAQDGLLKIDVRDKETGEIVDLMLFDREMTRNFLQFAQHIGAGPD